MERAGYLWERLTSFPNLLAAALLVAVLLGVVENAQLTAQGYHPIYTFTHDVERLPNGDTAVIAPTERTVNINGVPTEYVGMTIVVLDKDFQVAWAWDSFDHLEVNRGPILGEVL
jgi:hypothetical protein